MEKSGQYIRCTLSEEQCLPFASIKIEKEGSFKNDIDTTIDINGVNTDVRLHYVIIDPNHITFNGYILPTGNLFEAVFRKDFTSGKLKINPVA